MNKNLIPESHLKILFWQIQELSYRVFLYWKVRELFFFLKIYFFVREIARENKRGGYAGTGISQPYYHDGAESLTN